MFACSIPLLSALFNACTPLPPFATGYVEGEYVLIAPVTTAQIETIHVSRGDRVSKDQPLVDLERQDAEIGLTLAKASLSRAQSQLANLQEGRRPEEIAVIEASLASARAQAAEARRDADRQASLSERGASTPAQRDAAATQATITEAKAAELEANLAVARLPARVNEIEAAESAVTAARADEDRAAWVLDQRQLTAPAEGVIADLIRNPGEIAGPAAPVLSMLPDGAVKLRLYVSEKQVALIAPGTRLEVHCDACAPGLAAVVSYVADAPEFTPPVIYSLENRQKLVYLIEARPAPATGLKPGQIVDVTLPEVPQP